MALARFPEGTVLPEVGDRVVAVRWAPSNVIDDNETVPPGTKGRVLHADDLQIWVRWSNGSGISLVPGDEWKVVCDGDKHVEPHQNCVLR